MNLRSELRADDADFTSPSTHDFLQLAPRATEEKSADPKSLVGLRG